MSGKEGPSLRRSKEGPSLRRSKICRKCNFLQVGWCGTGGFRWLSTERVIARGLSTYSLRGLCERRRAVGRGWPWVWRLGGTRAVPAVWMLGGMTDDESPAARAGGSRRRGRGEAVRSASVRVRVSPCEAAAIAAAASRAGLSVGAWVGDVAVRAARADGHAVDGGVSSWREVTAALVAVRAQVVAARAGSAPGPAGEAWQAVVRRLDVLTEVVAAAVGRGRGL